MLEVLLSSPSSPKSGLSYRYVKIDEMYSDPGQLVGLVGLLVMSPGGENLCVKNAAIASASSFFDAGLAPKHIVDGTTSSRWVSASVSPQWLKVDLMKASVFNKIKLQILPGEAGRVPKRFQILGSNDNVSYTSIGTYTNMTYPDTVSMNPWKVTQATLDLVIPE